MTKLRVRCVDDLHSGDMVQVFVNNVVHFEGCVSDIHSQMGLFWAVDSLGERRLIELGVEEVRLARDESVYGKWSSETQ